jgi:Ca2+-binding RTX toxin-like protein
MNATHARAVTAIFLMSFAVLARGAHATPEPVCTIKGTAGADVLIGGGGRDVICGLGGNDKIDGQGGNDVIRGGPGDDMMQGGPGRDTLLGGTGNDTFDTWDGHTDVIDGGPGRDRGFVDYTDKVRNVERFG